MRKNLNELGISCLSFLLIIVILSCSPKPENRFEAYVEAHNSHDVERIMSFYAEDARFEFVESYVREGREEIRKQEEFDAALNSQLAFTDLKVNGGTVTGKVTEQSDYYRLAGIDEVYYEDYTIIFRDGLIKEIKTELTLGSVMEINEVFTDLLDWVRKEKKQELDDLILEGEVVYSAESAKKWLALLREWRENVSKI